METKKNVQGMNKRQLCKIIAEDYRRKLLGNILEKLDDFCTFNKSFEVMRIAKQFNIKVQRPKTTVELCKTLNKIDYKKINFVLTPRQKRKYGRLRRMCKSTGVEIPDDLAELIRIISKKLKIPLSTDRTLHLICKSIKNKLIRRIERKCLGDSSIKFVDYLPIETVPEYDLIIKNGFCFSVSELKKAFDAHRFSNPWTNVEFDQAFIESVYKRHKEHKTQKQKYETIHKVYKRKR